MPEFVLDTAGQAARPKSYKGFGVDRALKWSDLDAFTQGYIEALFFTENEPGTSREDRLTTRGTVRKPWEHDASEGRQKDMPGDYGFADLAPESLLAILGDCQKFCAGPYRQVELCDENTPDEAQAGRDFWYTRNGHGCGFWDGDWPEPYATQLTDACKSFGEVDIYLGDDGKVYLS
jgi:hypothetical protein